MVRRAPDRNTSDYRKARAKHSQAAIQEITCGVAVAVAVAVEHSANANPKWLWKNKTTHLIDGFSFKMPDTPKNQKVPFVGGTVESMGWGEARGARNSLMLAG